MHRSAVGASRTVTGPRTHQSPAQTFPRYQAAVTGVTRCRVGDDDDEKRAGDGRSEFSAERTVAGQRVDKRHGRSQDRKSTERLWKRDKLVRPPLPPKFGSN